MVAPETFGVNALDLVPGIVPAGDSASLSDSQRLTLMSAIGNAGLTLVRADVIWSEVEPTRATPATYDWGPYDKFVTDLAQYGLTWQPIVDGTPSWAGSCGPGAAYYGDYDAFANALAKRYGPGGSFWKANSPLHPYPVERYEIWNEPDGTDPCSPFTPYDYDVLYSGARAAIHSVDSQAVVIVGGLVTSTFAVDMLKDDPALVGNVDAWGFHPYYDIYATEPASTAFYQEPIDKVVTLRHDLTAAGVPATEPIYVTELGWTTSGTVTVYPNVCDNADSAATSYTPTCTANREDGLITTTDQLTRSNCNVAEYIVYSWYTSQADPTNQQEWFGIANLDGTLQPSAQAWASEVQLLYGNGSQPPPSGTVSLC